LLVLAPAASPLDAHHFGGEREMTAGEWARTDIEDGVPWITPETEDRFVPQMVNLDLLGGVSFNKGCYPGQEIVARMHYLGRLKQRMYRVKLRGDIAPVAGDALYSPRFGADQACGTLLNVARAPDEGYEALAVIRMESARERAVHWKDLAHPPLEFLPLPYPLPD
jgi:folate-binding protein YgfZ